ncbi:unnamed protein product [Paramecium pentaurelia]|uniref:Tetratricopeptide repeat protein n=1 Tax=Paramecium pentaurelia TaxID=43138 RepID=A0A8S1WG94_9CILI|nr:unnamed protein product [Paramecium pentaurelia]
MSDHDDNDNDQELQEETTTNAPKFEDYSDMDQTQIPIFEKNAGTDCFKKGDYFEATRHYAKAVMAYQFFIKDGVVNDPEEIKKLTQEIYLPCSLNLSLCYIKQKEYQMGKDFANKSLEVDANNIKGLYRRGICFMNLQEFKAAGEDFKRILEIDPNNDDAKQAWEQLIKKKEQIKQKQKAISEKMLNSLSYEDKIVTNTKKGKKNWLREKYDWLKQILCVRKKAKKN